MTPVGLPSSVIQKYLGEDGLEHTLSRTEYIYTPQGYIEGEHTFDAQGNDCGWTLRYYDEKGNCKEEYNPIAERTVRHYDENNNLVLEQGPRLDYYTEYAYDYCNRQVRTETVLASGERLKTHCNYDLKGRKTSEFDIYNNQTDYKYDDLDRIIEITHATVLDESGNPYRPVEQRSYNEMGYCTETIDPRGNKTATRYNIRGQPIEITHPDGAIQRKEYTIEGWLKKAIDPHGTVTTYEHDDQGRIHHVTVSNAKGEVLRTTSSTYNRFHLLSETDALGVTTRYIYDRAGRKIAVTIGERLTEYTYDSRGHLFETIEHFEQGQRIHRNYYDGLGRVSVEEWSDEKGLIYKKTSFAYDQDGNRIAVYTYNNEKIDATFTYYNAFGEQTKIVDAIGNETLFHYYYNHFNELGQIVKCTETIDALGNKTVLEYDAMQRPLRTFRLDPFNQNTHIQFLQYNRSGNPQNYSEWVHANGQHTRTILNSRLYDTCGHVVYQVEAVGTPEQKTVTHQYDLCGRRTKTIKMDGVSLNYTYDDLGRQTALHSSDNSVHYVYKYDKDDNLLEAEDLIQKSTTQREYNLYGDVQQETLATGLKTRYTYDLLRRISQVKLPDESSIRYGYDAYHLREIHRNSHSVFLEYDAYGNVIKKKHPYIGTIDLAYDELQRPVASMSLTQNEKMAYNAVSDLVNYNKDKIAKQYSYDALRQLTSETGCKPYNPDSLHNRVDQGQFNSLHQLISDNEATYGYDLNGNLFECNLQIGKTTFIYDALDRLVKVITPKEQVKYTYDAFHRRLSKEKASGKQLFLYDDQNEIGSFNIEGKLTELRILGSGKGAEIGATLFCELNGRIYDVHNDVFGNISQLIDQGGQIAEVISYNAFSEDLTESTHISPWRFSSKRYDIETGFVNFGRRYYMPNLGRWLTPDPLGLEDGPNAYAYVHHSPLIHFDLYGLFSFGDCWASIACAADSAWQYSKEIAVDAACGFGGGLVEGLLEPEGIVSRSMNPNQNYSITRLVCSYIGDACGTAVNVFPQVRGVTQSVRAIKAIHAGVRIYNGLNTAAKIGRATHINRKFTDPSMLKAKDVFSTRMNGKGSPSHEHISPESARHILYGEKVNGEFSGGHLSPALSSKSPFPKTWDSQKILDAIYDVFKDPKTVWLPSKNPNNVVPREYGIGKVDGVKIMVIKEPASETIISGFPK